MKKIPIILDGDPGHDDAIAWVLANANKKFDILAVTTVSGNQTIEKTTHNAARIMTLIGLDVPLGKGGDKPLFGPILSAPQVHGESGLDGPILPSPKVEISEKPAVEIMADALKASPEKVTLIPTGPMTNIATLLITYPNLKEKIAHIAFMGGGLSHGNWTPAAEFNILVDPEAAKIVFESGIPLTMAGLDVTEKALVYPEDFEKIRKLDNPVAEVVAQWLDFFYAFHLEKGYTGAPVHDAVAIASLIAPEIMTTKDLFVQVETQGEYCLGATFADYFGLSKKKPNMKVILDIDRKAFVDLLIEACAHYKEVES